jgi:tetratricopeptide (TPR) repeat protein
MLLKDHKESKNAKKRALRFLFAIFDSLPSLRRLLPVLALLVFTGCATEKHQRQSGRAVELYMSGDYARAQHKLESLADKKDEDFVLNNVRLGSAALAHYDLDAAEAAFLRAYEVINSVGVNDGGRTLGATLVDEKLKIWKGEPYERAMTNFYLGLIYYMRQDYNNARAAFENALFKLRDYTDPKDAKHGYTEQESNFVVASVMLGRCWQRLGREDLARANFDRARELRSELSSVADYDRNLDSNLLLVVDFGYGPRKVTDFDGSIVGFAPTPLEAGRIPEPRVVIDGRTFDTGGADRPPIDTLAMAQDRRWQSIDTIRTVKSVVGTGLIAGGAATGLYGMNRRNQDATIAGLAMIGTGLLLKATSQADVRQWEMLPRTTFVIPLRVEPGKHDVTVEFPHAPGLRQTWRGLVVPERGDAAYYFRMQRWSPGPFDWPPPALAGRAGASSASGGSSATVAGE